MYWTDKTANKCENKDKALGLTLLLVNSGTFRWWIIQFTTQLEHIKSSRSIETGSHRKSHIPPDKKLLLHKVHDVANVTFYVIPIMLLTPFHWVWWGWIDICCGSWKHSTSEHWQTFWIPSLTRQVNLKESSFFFTKTALIKIPSKILVIRSGGLVGGPLVYGGNLVITIPKCISSRYTNNTILDCGLLWDGRFWARADGWWDLHRATTHIILTWIQMTKFIKLFLLFVPNLAHAH